MTETPELNARTLFVAGFFFELSLALVGVLVGWLFAGDPLPFELVYDLEALIWGLAATVPWALAAVLFTSTAGRRVPFLRRIYERVRKMLGAAVRDLRGEEIVLLSAAAGIGEEVLFRGVLQGLAGIWATSVLFGLLHALTPSYFILATLISLYLGWLQLETGNLLVPILVHGIYDTFALLLMRRQFRREEETAAGDPERDEDGAARESGPAGPADEVHESDGAP